MVNWIREKQNLMIVDLSSIAFRFYKNPEQMVEGLHSMIIGFGVSYDAKDIIVCCDYGRSTYRLNLYPEYKANRRAKAKDRTEQEQLDVDFYYDCQNEAIKTLKDKGVIVLQEYGVEADDLVAYSIRKLADKYSHSWIISADKDFNALLSYNVSQYSTSQAKTMDLKYLKDTFDCTPETFLRALIISGDTSDNIKGYYLVGEPKKAASRSMVYAKMGSTFGEICTAIRNKNKIGKIDQFILDNIEIYARNKLLIELHDSVLTDEQKAKIDNEIKGLL